MKNLSIEDINASSEEYTTETQIRMDQVSREINDRAQRVQSPDFNPPRIFTMPTWLGRLLDLF